MNTFAKFIVHRSSFLVLFALACASPENPSHHVARIVSLAPNVTEMLFAAGCGAKVVATDNFSDYPEAVKRLPKVGGVEPDVERIASMRADLVVASASNAHPNLRRALAAAHVPLLVIKTDRLDEIPSAASTVEQACGGSATLAIAAAIQQQRRTRAKPPRVLFAVWTDPMYVAGRQTYVDDLLHLTGADNAVEANGWPQYPLETFAAHPPDLLLYPGRSVTAGAVADLLRRAHVHAEAVAVDENVFMRPGPRVALAAAELNRIFDQWEHSH